MDGDLIAAIQAGRAQDADLQKVKAQTDPLQFTTPGLVDSSAVSSVVPIISDIAVSVTSSDNTIQIEAS